MTLPPKGYKLSAEQKAGMAVAAKSRLPRPLDQIDPKRCTKCGVLKPLTEFYLHTKKGSQRPRRRSDCKQCAYINTRTSTKKNPERHRQTNKRWRQRNKEYHRDVQCRKLYGITLAQAKEMVASQRGCCAICHEPMQKWHIDHDHKTGAVRAILCNKCNCAMGSFDDSIGRMFEAINYLLRYKSDIREIA